MQLKIPFSALVLEADMSSKDFPNNDDFEPLISDEDDWLSDSSQAPPEGVGEPMPEEAEETPVSDAPLAAPAADEAEAATEPPPTLQWYVAHTFSGYENKVKANIEKIVENRGMQDLIHEVAVPVQEAIEIKNGKTKTIMRKIYPGYVFLHMIMNGDTWYIVRNTRGVTSFVGPGSKFVPLSDDEVKAMGIGEQDTIVRLAEGDCVRVTSGPFAQSIGTVKEVNSKKRTVTVLLSVFGRVSPLELDLAIVSKEEESS
jgi:transcriptional antiterminator NusG